ASAPARPGTGLADFDEARLGGAARDVLISHEVEQLIRDKERLVADRRRAAITLYERFLVEHPGSPEEAEVLFQLAELRWEGAKAAFLVGMAAYQAAVERCARERCRERPAEPALHLDSSQALYRRLIDEHPGFPKIDAVHYLYGYSLRDQGNLPE